MNKRQILTTILSVLLSVFLVAGVVYAVTTISTNIVTEGSLTVTEGLTLNEVSLANRGEGTYILVDEKAIGLETPADVSGVKMEFDYGATPTIGTSWGKMAHGLDVKMIMDQDYDFSAGDKPYNATVRGGRIQVYSQNDVSGRIVGLYAAAQAQGTSTIKGYYTGTAPSPGIVGIHARTELGNAAAITTPSSGAVGIVVFHRNQSNAVLTGYYRGIQIESGHPGVGGSISGTKTGIYFGVDLLGEADFFDVGIDMSAMTFGTADIVLSNGETIDNATDGTIKFTSDAGTISGENHGISLTHTGIMSSGDQMVGGNFVVTTAGDDEGAWVSGIFAKVIQPVGTRDVGGYISGGEFEVDDSCLSPSYVFPLVLNANSDAWGTNSAFVMLQDFGGAQIPNFLYFPHSTIGAGNMIAVKGSAAVSHTLRIKIAGTAYYIMLSNVQ